MFRHCPGVGSLVTPGIVFRPCPFCGEEVEFFEYETQQKCPGCGKTVYREASEACISWCAYVDKCIGDLEGKALISRERAEELRSLWAKLKKDSKPA